MKAADGEDSPVKGSFARTETGFNFPTSFAAWASVNLLSDKPGRKMTVKSRRAPSKMGDILCSLSSSVNQVSVNLNFFSQLLIYLYFSP